MRWSQLLIPTLRDDPAGAESASHRLLSRAGYIQQIGSGIYSLLPLAQKVRLKIIAIIREEMQRIAAQECLLPVLSPTEYWTKSGRLETMGPIMFRLRDRKASELVLGVTHEEIFTHVASRHLQSYKQLPQIWYHFQTKFRDELRPRGGLLRVREFTMKDSYSFDLDDAGLDHSYNLHKEAYLRIFKRLGIDVIVAEADSGIMGGASSAEFLLPTEAGEDILIHCRSCQYASNQEKAESLSTKVEDGESQEELVKFATPGVRTIAELEAFEGGASADRQIKTLVLRGQIGLFLVLLRGDAELHLERLRIFMEDESIEAADADEIKAFLGAEPGSLGAVGLSASTLVLADQALAGRSNMVTGANQDGFHYRGVSMDRDIKVGRWAFLRIVREGDACVRCGDGLRVENALELGHIFKLGRAYSEALGATVLNEDGSKTALVMGSYGIGVERVLAASVEISHDKKGIIWPLAIAPYSVLITPVNMADEAIAGAAEEIYSRLKVAGFDVLLDDRHLRAGVKFNDGDLIGIPIRITVGKKIASQEVEIFERSTNSNSLVPVADLVKEIEKLMRILNCPASKSAS